VVLWLSPLAAQLTRSSPVQLTALGVQTCATHAPPLAFSTQVSLAVQSSMSWYALPIALHCRTSPPRQRDRLPGVHTSATQPPALQ